MKILIIGILMFLIGCGGSGGSSTQAAGSVDSPGTAPAVYPTPVSVASPSQNESQPTPTPIAETTPSPTPTLTPNPSPLASPTPLVFSPLHCETIQGTSVRCTNANMYSDSVVLDLTPYLTPTIQVLNITINNNLGQGEQQCAHIYLGQTDCTCIHVTFWDTLHHIASGPYNWCGTGINTTTNFLKYL